MRYKPGSVPPFRAVSVIYLRLQSPATSSNLPLDIGRAALHASIYLVLHPVGCTAGECHHLRGRLLPCLFTLTDPCGLAVIFCYTLPRPYEHLSVKKHGALWCPDFPPVGCADRRQTPLATFWGAKVTILFQTPKTNRTQPLHGTKKNEKKGGSMFILPKKSYLARAICR